jgi:hypothetical protein
MLLTQKQRDRLKVLHEMMQGHLTQVAKHVLKWQRE